jgi:hypothetical protein
MIERDIGIGSLLKTASEAHQYQSCPAPLNSISTATRPMLAGDGVDARRYNGDQSRGQIMIGSEHTGSVRESED